MAAVESKLEKHTETKPRNGLEEMVALSEKLRLALFERPDFEELYELAEQLQEGLEAKAEHEEQKQEAKVYKAIRTWNDLIDANVLFLKGKLRRTPYHAGPVDPETVPLLGNLVKIHELGKIYTIEGQPGICEKDTKLPSGMLYRMQQRNYLVGVLPTALATVFKDCLGDDARVAYEFQNAETGKTDGTILFSGTVPATLTREKVYATPAHEAKTEWRPSTAKGKDPTWAADSVNYFEKYPRVVRLLRPATWFIVAGYSWCAQPVEEIVLRCVSSAVYQKALAAFLSKSTTSSRRSAYSRSARSEQKTDTFRPPTRRSARIRAQKRY